MKKRILFSLTTILLLSACGNSVNKSEKKEQVKEQKVSEIQEIKNPTKMGSSVPNLFINHQEEIYLSWIESLDNGISVLYYSVLKENTWQAPNKIAKGDNWVVNWADFPSLIQFGKNSLAVNYLLFSNPETYAYDVQLAISNDNGRNWNAPFSPHKDGTQTEHGFVSLVPYQDNSFMAIWLDGRKYAEEMDEMTLRAAIINKKGVIEEEFVLDERVCDCCGTNAIATENGITVIYRNRDENEVRDMATVTFKGGKWSAPKFVFKDNWEIAGCPVNGAAIDAIENTILVAWFTEANDEPTVKFSFSDGLDSNFNAPLTINTSTPIGRVDVCSIGEEIVAVSWMEGDVDNTYLKVRTVRIDGSGLMGEPVIVSEMSASRSTGFPKMVKKGKQLLFAWTDVKEGKPSTIKTVLVNELD